MTTQTQEVFNQALNLSLAERTELIEQLFTSLEPPVSNTINSRWIAVKERVNAYRAKETDEERFQRLREEWEVESAHLSSPADMAMVFAYQQIIGMGLPAVPLILKDLQRESNHWFWALTVITGANPVSEEDLGRIDRMTEAWVVWGKEQGFID